LTPSCLAGGVRRTVGAGLQEFPLSQATGDGVVHGATASFRLPFGELHAMAPESLSQLRHLAARAAGSADGESGAAAAAAAALDSALWRRKRARWRSWPAREPGLGEPVPIARFPSVAGSHRLPAGVGADINAFVIRPGTDSPTFPIIVCSVRIMMHVLLPRYGGLRRAWMSSWPRRTTGGCRLRCTGSCCEAWQRWRPSAPPTALCRR
jgi:hypothetical protein